jgi:hypothetical protein
MPLWCKDWKGSAAILSPAGRAKEILKKIKYFKERLSRTAKNIFKQACAD